MSVSDPWLHTLNNLHPLYSQWQDLLSNGPIINASCKKVEKQWHITINEDWGILDREEHYIPNCKNLENRINWTNTQLSSWKNVSRLDDTTWSFSCKKDAEKFITLFNIVWPLR